MNVFCLSFRKLKVFSLLPCLFAGILDVQLAKAQRIEPVGVGTRIKYDVFENELVRNGYDSALLENKLFILDFFATWCSSCLKSFPKLQEFQKRYQDQLQVLLVTKEPLEKIEELKKKNKLFASIDLPILYNDTLLNNIFRHKLIPHLAWINAQGIVRAITDETALTEENLANFISDKRLSLTLKQDDFDFHRKNPLLLNNNGGDLSKLIGRSMLTSYLPGIAGGQGNVEEENITRWYFLNTSLLSLYKRAIAIPPNRILLNLQNPERYSQQDNEDYKQQNLFSWECWLPKNANAKLLTEILLKDLNTYSPLNGKLVNRKTNCWVLTISDLAKFKSSTKAPGKHSTAPTIKLKHQPLSDLITQLNQHETGSPIILDETGFKQNLTIQLLSQPGDLPAIAKELSAYGLSLKPAVRTLEVFLVTEKHPQK